MIQFKISDGQLAGVVHDVRQFPFRVGRSPQSDLQLEEPGVWDDHLVVEFDPSQGFMLSTQGQAITSVNGCPVQSVRLHNGDGIEVGSLKMSFWIGATKQSSQRVFEWFVWMVLVLVTVAELGLLFWLAKLS